MRRIALAAVVVGVLLHSPVSAQTFSSGSTGVDGALDLSTTKMNCETGPYAPLPGQAAGCWIQLPESGILNYTTVNVPYGKILFFRKNRQNTPVVIRAQGNVVIEGTINLDATTWQLDGRTDWAQPGPGGFPGGWAAGGASGVGYGPGGGTLESPHGRWVGPLSLVPLIGGSGGTGCGGGGAIVIASGGDISVVGSISAGSIGCGSGYGNYGGYGSGGAIRLVANRIFHRGNTTAYGAAGNNGFVRLEAPAGAISFSGSSTPTPVLSTIGPTIVADAAPELTIVTVGGFSVPTNAGNRKDAADLVLPKQLPDPIYVVVAASNIPIGSPVAVSFGTSNQGTAPAALLAGTLASSTATIGVTGLNRDQLAYLYVQVLFGPPASGGGGADIPESERVAQVRMTSAPGARPQFAFLRSDGAEIPLDKLPVSLQGWVSSSYSR